jgi:hypothetical protein
MRIRLGFVAEWSIATIIGVVVGTFLGADKVGLVQHLPGDFLFGLSIGIAQFPVLYRYLPKRDNRLLLWIAASAIAFPISVTLGLRSVSILPYNPDLFNLYFGIGMGLGHSLIQTMTIRIILPSARWRFLYWMPFALVAWMIAEVIPLDNTYTLALSIPVGLALGLITGIGWLLIFKPTRPQPSLVPMPKDS